MNLAGNSEFSCPRTLAISRQAKLLERASSNGDIDFSAILTVGDEFAARDVLGNLLCVKIVIEISKKRALTVKINMRS